MRSPAAGAAQNSNFAIRSRKRVENWHLDLISSGYFLGRKPRAPRCSCAITEASPPKSPLGSFASFERCPSCRLRVRNDQLQPPRQIFKMKEAAQWRRPRHAVIGKSAFWLAFTAAPHSISGSRRPKRIRLCLCIDISVATDETAMVATRPAALVQRAVGSRSPGVEIPSPALSPLALRPTTPSSPRRCAGSS
jgi:hypothetical protein